MKRRKKKTVNRGVSVMKKARNTPAVRSKVRAISKLEARIKKLRRQKESVYKKALRRLTKKKR